MNGMEELRQKKLEELMQKAQKQQEEQMQAEAKISQITKNFLTEEARLRLANVRLVNNSLFENALSAIIYLAQSGRMTQKLDDEELRALLEKLAQKKEMRIRRK